MPGTTPRGWPYPLGTEPADGSPQIEALARAIDTDLTTHVTSAGHFPAFATTAARDAAIPSPTDGMQCVTVDTYTHWYARGGVWAPKATSGGGMDLGPLQLRVGVLVVTADTQGFAAITFPTPFRTQCLGAVAVNGDCDMNAKQWFAEIKLDHVTASGMWVRCIADNGTVVNAPVRINYLAFGT